MKIEQDLRKVKKKKALSICVSEGWMFFFFFFFDDAHYVSSYNLSFKTKRETGAKLVCLYNVYLPHDPLVYPPKIYLPTLIIVTVGPLPSHRE